MGMYKDLELKVDCSKGGPSLTKQQFADEVDINKIVARFEKTGMIDHVNRGTPFYGDVSDVADYHAAMNTVRRSEELFMGMSADVRSKFANDPGLMIEWLKDPKNHDEAVRLGMIVPKPIEKVQDVRVVNEPESHSKAHKGSKKGKSSDDDE